MEIPRTTNGRAIRPTSPKVLKKGLNRVFPKKKTTNAAHKNLRLRRIGKSSLPLAALRSRLAPKRSECAAAALSAVASDCSNPYTRSVGGGAGEAMAVPSHNEIDRMH
jgi:hypothetical protein